MPVGSGMRREERDSGPGRQKITDTEPGAAVRVCIRFSSRGPEERKTPPPGCGQDRSVSGILPL